MKLWTARILASLATINSCHAALKQYKFTITNGTLAPDAFSREVYMINGQNSGPLIEVDEGDELEVEVFNKLGVDTTIHWHGLFQKGTPFMDGVPGVSQYPILPGGNFTYRFSIGNQYGLYWWHSHFRATYADSIRGPLLVRANQTRVRPYEVLARGVPRGVEILRQAENNSQTVMVNDWNHMTSAETYAQYNRTGAFPNCADSLLANGVGRVICLPEHILQKGPGLGLSGIDTTYSVSDNLTTPLDVRGCTPPNMFNPGYSLDDLPTPTCVNTTAALLVIPANDTNGWLALHLVNAGSVAKLSVSLDSHAMYVYEADGLFVNLQEVKVLQIAIGQRYSVMISLDQTPGDYALRYAAYPTGDMQQVIVGQSIVTYLSTGLTRSHAYPDIEAQYMLLNGTQRPNDASIKTLQPAALSPFDQTVLPAMTSNITKVFAISQTEMTSWIISNASYVESTVPVLFGETSTAWVANTTLHIPRHTWVDIIMTIDSASMDQMGHPMHLHGHKFFVLGSGEGPFPYSTVAEAPQTLLNFVNPPFRDTAALPAKGWLVIRYLADNPGAWLLHCHILWHLVSGMAVVLVEGESDIPGLLSAANVDMNPPVSAAWGLQPNALGVVSIIALGMGTLLWI